MLHLAFSKCVLYMSLITVSVNWYCTSWLSNMTNWFTLERTHADAHTKRGICSSSPGEPQDSVLNAQFLIFLFYF